MKERFAVDVRFEEVDLYGLVDGERDAAIDAITSGLEMPLVIVADKVVYAGNLDVDRIADALQSAGALASPKAAR